MDATLPGTERVILLQIDRVKVRSKWFCKWLNQGGMPPALPVNRSRRGSPP